MPATVVQYSLTSGEISPRLLMRGDTEAYPNAAQVVENFFIDYRGGAVSRPGTEWVGMARGPFRDVSIQLAFVPGGGLVLEVSDQRFRFVQEGVYVTEEAKTVSAVSGTQVTITAHGYSVDDWLLVDGKQVRVRTVVSADVVELENIWGTSWVPSVGATVGRIYELAVPYLEADIWSLNFTTLESEVIITSGKYPPKKLVFNALADWTLEDLNISASAMTTVTGLTCTPQKGAGTAYYVYAVSAVLDTGEETTVCKPVVVKSYQMSTDNAESIWVQWDPLPNAQYYIIYRSREFLDTKPSLGEELGYCGKAYGTEFIDKNILPDFTKTPITPYNPFADGAVSWIGVSAEGSGYLDTSTLTVSGSGGSGSGFIGYPIITKTDKIGAVKVLNPGSGYIEPVTVTVTDGTGASFNPNVSPMSGNWPRCSARFQQRLVFAGTDNKPGTVFGSRPGEYYNFSYTIPSQHDDSYEHTIDTSGVQYIKFLLATNSGLMIFTDAGVFVMSGDNTGRSVTPLRVQVSPQMSLGSADLQPVVVDNDILFVQSKGAAVRALRYNPVSASYSAEDLTLLASHLLEEYNIKDWTYAADPFRQIVGIREDGVLLCLTYVPGQKVFAWSRSITDGKFLTCASTKEYGSDIVYVGVERRINGRVVYFQERFNLRKWNTVRAVFAVDAGLRRVGEAQTVQITIESDGSFSTSATLNVGDLIVADGARVEVTGSGTGTVLAEPFSPWPVDTDQWVVFRGKVSSVSGLEHLEGETVSILADGDVHTQKTVVDGSVSLDVPAWEVAVGLPFRCRIKTMPIDVMQPAVQGKRRRHWKTTLLVQASRGMWVGSSWNDLYEVKEVDLASVGQAQELYTGWRQMTLVGSWKPDSAVHVEVVDPLPCALLGLTVNVTFGDDDVR